MVSGVWILISDFQTGLVDRACRQGLWAGLVGRACGQALLVGPMGRGYGYISPVHLANRKPKYFIHDRLCHLD